MGRWFGEPKLRIASAVCWRALVGERGVLKNREGFSTFMGPPYPGRALKNYRGFSTHTPGQGSGRLPVPKAFGRISPVGVFRETAYNHIGL